jgi:hypothetical protein
VGFEPTISAGEGPQTYALDCAATGTGINYVYTIKITHKIGGFVYLPRAARSQGQNNGCGPLPQKGVMPTV